MKLLALFYQNPAGYLTSFMLLVFSAVSFAINNNTALVFLVAFVFVLLANILYSLLSFKATRKYIKQVNKSLSQEKINNVNSFPLPCAMCDSKGNIIWFNKEFGENVLTDNQKVSMYDFFDDFNYYVFSENKTADAEFNGKLFTAFITRIKSKSTPMLCVYFFDDTYMKETAKEYELSRPFVMSIFVDNIDQLSRQLTDSKFAQVTSGIERKIENWLKDEKLILKKTGNGNFFVIGEKRNLDKLCEEKFSVLKDVRAYKHNNNPVNATLSIGVGTGEDLSQCESRAKKALEMSLGRGGDQAAVKTENGYRFFGGVSKGVEKKSRAKTRIVANAIQELILSSENVFIMGHRFGDLDSVGAACGLAGAVRLLQKPVAVVVNPQRNLAPQLLSLMEHEIGGDLFLTPAQALETITDQTLLIIVDTHNKEILESEKLYKMAKNIVVIDHHRKNVNYVDNALVFHHEPYASSACEMVTELIQYFKLDNAVPSCYADCLLSGIMLDTKNFVMRTGVRTFEAAAYLRKIGADTVKVKCMFSGSIEAYRSRTDIVGSAEVIGCYAIAIASEEVPDVRLVAPQAADELLSIQNVSAAFVIYEINRVVNISARSLGAVNVQVIMEALGGGGHQTMAATQLHDISVQDAKVRLLQVISDMK
jgi:c-di-AMP phosphodiesterase-like protein